MCLNSIAKATAINFSVQKTNKKNTYLLKVIILSTFRRSRKAVAVPWSPPKRAKLDKYKSFQLWRNSFVKHQIVLLNLRLVFVRQAISATASIDDVSGRFGEKKAKDLGALRAGFKSWNAKRKLDLEFYHKLFCKIKTAP